MCVCVCVFVCLFVCMREQAWKEVFYGTRIITAFGLNYHFSGTLLFRRLQAFCFSGGVAISVDFSLMVVGLQLPW